MIRPDLFIVGAPKCGTTTLYRLLRDHPQVFMATPKEPHFFSTDVHVPGAIRRPEAYHALFEGAGDVRRIGEASVSYLASEVAPAAIQAFAPRARIVAMLRHPVDALCALHAQLVFEVEAEHEDLEQALAIQEADRERILRTRGLPYIYREAVRFSSQLPGYLDRFSNDGVHVILLDDLARDPVQVWQELTEFLEIEAIALGAVQPANPRKQARSSAVQRIAKHPPRWLATVLDLTPTGLRRAASATLLRLNSVEGQGIPIPLALRQRLQRELRPEVEQLADLIGRDLGAWLD